MKLSTQEWKTNSRLPVKIAVLGGTFNPLHKGHQMLAEEVCKAGYDKVLFVPAYLPPHKEITSSISAFDRLEMVRHFCEKEGKNRFYCESCEMDRGGVSYTCDTLEFIADKYKNEIECKIAFVLGEESAAQFHKWKNPERIVEIADLIIARRKPVNVDSGAGSFNKPKGNFGDDFSAFFNPEKFGFPFIELQNPEIDVSSTEIRSLILNNGNWKDYVPDSVYEYIQIKQLYRKVL